MTIDRFRGQWAKLGNYSPCLVFYDGHAYQSVEHAYQAQKSLDPDIQQQIRWAPGPAAAKKLARSVALRPDWDAIKVEVMRVLLWEKFQQEPERGILLSTGDAELREGNWWHDNVWGECGCEACRRRGPGQNQLGRLLMATRARLRQEEPR